MANAAAVRTSLAPAGNAAKKSNPLVSKLKKELESQMASKGRLVAKIRDSRDTMARTGMVFVTKIEAGSVLLLSSIAEGRWGKKMKLGGKVDARLIPGIPLVLAGLYLTATDSAAAPHIAAIGDGFLGSFLASTGREIGEAWRDKAPAPAAPVVGDVSNLGDVVNLGGLRELALTESDILTAGSTAADPHNRFRAAEALPR